ncbi:hypothetical protein FHU41_002840 [Psychromicrobium silvestre]|uniref:DUF3052 domain-containing protein n=1 Tax=Psychromicrobium silvestre TaxID=1645614 RepID=A0A7Y9S8M6_9MICC|nr:DUF3052 domain-containing protein [Psychromicrobium silvestre]NYE96590.1 hypothetical protein [Psychromicrobium silvestre]
MTNNQSGSAGYSGTPLVRKIGIKAGHRLRFSGRPEGWELPGLPEQVTEFDTEVRAEDSPEADVVLAFFRELTVLRAASSKLALELDDRAMLWIAWPRKAAGHRSDITENSLRELLLPLGLVDVKVAALDHDWSGLKFVRRKENRG